MHIKTRDRQYSNLITLSLLQSEMNNCGKLMELNLPPRFKYVAELPGEIRLFNFFTISAANRR